MFCIHVKLPLLKGNNPIAVIIIIMIIITSADFFLEGDTVTVMLSFLLFSTFTVKIPYKLYSMHQKCT